ncbi:MAG: tryptophan synthase alpha chain [Thermomicrobiales bacterium]|nr:tryptophan synthase alpha chain [Thermomicrobiales bacterium]
MSAVSEETETTRVDAKTNRIAAAFSACKAQGRAALIPFVTGGYPTLAKTEELLPALVEGGADLIEIGIPFSDPLADGATVQHTSQVALEQGTTLTDCLALVRRVRAAGLTVPILFMGYSNPFYQYGLQRLARDAAEAGVDGFIVPDLPIEESDEFLEPFRAEGLDLIFMLAPTSTESRIEAAAQRASGFIYCVSLVGVTGAREALSDELPAYLARVRSHTDVPLVVGFGISRPDHVRTTAAIADGVVVASALTNHMDHLPPEEQVAGATAFVRGLAAATGKDGQQVAVAAGSKG